MKNWKYRIFITVFSLIALEILLRLFGINDTYQERVGGKYDTYWNKKQDSWYHTSMPNATFYENNIDFHYIQKTNSLGNRELEPDSIFNDSTGRVIVIGDSYTWGVGVVYDSSFVRHLQNISKADRVPLSFYNAGVSGNDPLFAFTMIRDKLLQYHPDVIIITINTSDYPDLIYRGGFERFLPDSTTEFRHAPWFEPVYRHCYVFRMVLHDFLRYVEGDLFMSNRQYRRACFEINRQFVAVADSLHALSMKNGFKPLFLIHSGPCELIYDCFENRLYKQLFQELNDTLKAKGYYSVNLWEPMDKVINEDNRLLYGFKHDGHFSGKGYKLMAKTAWQETEKYYPGFWIPQRHAGSN